ncbi:carbohydrate-binding protein, partial [Anaeromassilibacillus sp. Marseille-P3371]|uniref:carbohydrate-binding protein n=1 Tax=Anaeromassilibacillus sp. Marseille-P3371 TaxID=1944639 RepID=UPI001301F8F7
MRKKKVLSLLLAIVMVFSMMAVPGVSAFGAQKATTENIGDVTGKSEDGNVLIFQVGGQEVRVELCTPRTVRVQLSLDGADGYRPEDPQYYMVQKNEWDPVDKTVTDEGDVIKIRTSMMEIRVQKSPLRIGMYDLEGNLLSKDADDQGMYWDDSGIRGVKKVEGTQNAGGIFGFGSGDHGRRSNLNRYDNDFTEFTMSHGRVIAPFFMSTVGYGVFLNTIEEDTKFFKHGGGFQTKGYLDYYFMYGPDFKTILNEYAEITGRMELYGKWAHGFMLSKYGNDNATQAEFLEWLHRLRDEGYPTDCYVFDYGWRGDVADNGNPQHGAGEKWGKQMWSNDKTKFPDIDAMFKEADELGFRVGLHNNAGTPEASGGKELYKPEYEEKWVKSYMDSVITTGYGDWFWPDEFDVLGSNTAPTFSSKGAYEAWKEYTVESRPMFITRGSYAGQHFATAWSGDINNTSAELDNQIGFSIDTGLIGYWASSNDLGGFMKRPTDELYTRWVSEFGAWSGIMRTHGHDGREPWTYDETAQETLKENLKIRYALYPYIYSLAWQGYSQGVPIMRAMLLEDDSQYNPDAWDLNKQYYYGDWFLVAPASATTDTVVSVWLPPHTTWYNYYTGERYEGGEIGKTIHVAAALDEIPVFVKSGAIVPMGPDVNYADEKPLDPLTLDIYPKGTTTFTLYEDDGESRRYITEDAYSTTTFESVQEGKDISFKIHAREDHNPDVYTPDERSYNLKFNHIAEINGVTINGTPISAAESLEEYNAAEQAYWLDAENHIVYVRTPDTGDEINVVLDSNGIVEPALGDEDEGLPPPVITDGERFELEDAEMLPTAEGEVKPDNEWKGYTGSGFAKGFKKEGDAVQFEVNVENAGTYDLVLRVNNGKKNDPAYDSAPRTGGLYIQDQKAADLSFEITDVWGNVVDGVKQGVWVDYTYRVQLAAGINTIKIRAEGNNPGNYNLDSVTFNRVDTSTNAFGRIEAESSSHLEGGIAVVEDEAVSNGSLLRATENGAWAQFDEVRGTGRTGVTIRVRSTTGGSIIVYENGVGDKILTTITLPSDGEWHTLNVDSKDTDAETSNIFLSFVGEDDFNCDVDWFHFTTDRETVDAYSQIEAESADEREGIDTTTKTVNGEKIKLLNHIENGDWAKFADVNFGNGGVSGFETRVAAGLQGGTLEVRLDSESGIKVAEVTIESTGDWNTLKVFSATCKDIKGIHDVYLKFVNTTTDNSICDMDWIRFTRDVATVSTQVEGGTATVTVDAPDPVEEGNTVKVEISNIEVGKEFDSISAETQDGTPVKLTEVEAGKAYTFAMPNTKLVTVTVTLKQGENIVEPGSVFELENARGDTSSSKGDGSGKVRVDTEWAGYTGTGYTAGWKAVGHYVEFDVHVQQSGIYDLVLHAGNGKKNEAKYDNTPRTGALYVDGVKVADFGLEVHDSWGDWFEHAIEGIELTEGSHTIKIRSEGSDNPGNFNLDSLRFDRVGDLSPAEPQLLTVQWSSNAAVEVEGNADVVISTDAIYGAKVMPGEDLTFTFTPT